MTELCPFEKTLSPLSLSFLTLSDWPLSLPPQPGDGFFLVLPFLWAHLFRQHSLREGLFILDNSLSLSHNSVSPPLDFKKAFESSASHEHKKRARDFFRRLHRRRRRSLFSNANDHRSGLVSVGGILFLFVIGKASKKFQRDFKSKLFADNSSSNIIG